MIVTAICAPAGASVPVAEPCWMRASKCPLGPVPAMWTLLAACKAAAAACSTSAGDFFSRPLVGGPVAVVAPPHAPTATVTSAAVAVARIRARAWRMRVIDIIPPHGRLRAPASGLQHAPGTGREQGEDRSRGKFRMRAGDRTRHVVAARDPDDGHQAIH